MPFWLCRASQKATPVIMAEPFSRTNFVGMGPHAFSRLCLASDIRLLLCDFAAPLHRIVWELHDHACFLVFGINPRGIKDDEMNVAVAVAACDMSSFMQERSYAVSREFRGPNSVRANADPQFSPSFYPTPCAASLPVR
jgi:hypothetical protein